MAKANGKGSLPRKQDVTDQTVADNWARTFGPKPRGVLTVTSTTAPPVVLVRCEHDGDACACQLDAGHE